MHESSQFIETAAAIMLDERLDDAVQALRVAAKRLGLKPSVWPKPAQVRIALNARLRLLDSHSAQRASAMRIAATEAMQALAEFNPRTYGSFLDGVAAKGSVIHLECACEHPDALAAKLSELKIPFEQVDQQGKFAEHCHFEFKAGEFDFHVHALRANSRANPEAQSLAKLSNAECEN
jgi:hypothetical protein